MSGLRALVRTVVPGLRPKACHLRPFFYAHNILAPVINRTVHRILRSHSTGTRVLRCEPTMPPGIEPISREMTR